MKIIQRIKSLFTGGNRIPPSWDWAFWQQGKSEEGISFGPNAVVEACVQRYAQTVSQLKAYHKSISPDGGKRLLLDTPLAKVMRKPNSQMSRSEFFLNLVYQLYSDGNAYALATRDDRRQVESLWIVPSRLASVQRVADTGDIFYSFTGSQFDFNDHQSFANTYAQRDVLHVRLNSDYMGLKGVSPISHHAASIRANSAILGGSAHFFSNMSRPSGILSTDVMLKRSEIDILREAWNNQSQGLDSGKIPIIAGGLKFSPLQMNSQDSQTVEAYNMTVREIANAYGLPLPLLNSMEQATFSNVSALISHWLSSGLGFALNHLESVIGDFFQLPANEELVFDEKELLRTDFKNHILGLKTAVQGGIATINEARLEIGANPVEGGDVPLVQSQMVPISEVVNKPEPEPPPPPQPVIIEEATLDMDQIEYYIKRGLTDDVKTG